MARIRKPPLPEHKHEVDEFHRLIEGGESDRGAALVGAALLDDMLAELLKAHFVDDGSSASSFLGEKNDGPLSTFSSRIKLCYLVGMIGRDLRIDLDRIREIRNKFAHHRAPLTFEDPEIQAWCGNLNATIEVNKWRAKAIPVEKPIKEARDSFIVACALIRAHLQWFIREARHQPVGRDYRIKGYVPYSELSPETLASSPKVRIQDARRRGKKDGS